MKRITLAAFIAVFSLLLGAVNMSAETILANFETDMGTEPINFVGYCQTNSWVLSNSIAANIVKDEIMNKTNNSYMVHLGANYDWWGNFLDFHLAAPITITEDNRYLHILHYRSVLNDPWWVCLNTDWNLDDEFKGKTRFDGNNAKAGVWEDIVVDMNYLIENGIPLTKFNFAVSLDWSDPKNNPEANYYFDEIVLNSNPLPRGVNILPDTEMSLFPGDEASYTKWVSVLDLQNAENTYSIKNNPFTTETAVLNSSKIMQFNKSANASWWQGPRFKFPGVYQVDKNDESSYLHVMVNIPEMQEGQDNYTVQLCAKNYFGKEVNSSDVIKYSAVDKGKWVDCVLDVTSLGYVSEVQVRFDVRKDASDAYINSPAGAFYLDAFTINNSEAPRTQIAQSLSPVGSDDSNVYSLGSTIVVNGKVTQVSVYNMVGELVSKTLPNTDFTSVSVRNSGFYLVRVVSDNGSISCHKVMVQ